MTTEAQKLALLEWAGWTEITVSTCYGNKQGIPPSGYCHRPAPALDEEDKRQWCWIPDFSSLDVIAEQFESKLDRTAKEDGGLSQYDKYWYWINITAKGDYVGATAPQRIEALVRCLGLWK